VYFDQPETPRREAAPPLFRTHPRFWQWPEGVPMLFVRAVRDHFPGLNAALDRVIVRALATKPAAVARQPRNRGHGFDLEENTAISRGIVQQVLAFLQFI
jgi:hypothetical protein